MIEFFNKSGNQCLKMFLLSPTIYEYCKYMYDWLKQIDVEESTNQKNLFMKDRNVEKKLNKRFQPDTAWP